MGVSFSSYYQVDLGARAYAIRLGGKLLYLVSCFTGPFISDSINLVFSPSFGNKQAFCLIYVSLFHSSFC